MTPKNKHPEEDPLNPFNPDMWADQNKRYPRTDGDVMFGEVLKAQDELENPDQNFVGLARHEQGPDGNAPMTEPSKHELPEVSDTPKEVSFSTTVLNYFRGRFGKR